MLPPQTKGQLMGFHLFKALFFALATRVALSIAVALLCLAATATQAQGLSLPAIPGLAGSGQVEQEQTASAEELSRSLEVTIQALQNDNSREELVKQLKILQQGLQAQASEDQRNSPTQQGLLGALAEFFDDLTRSDGAAGESLGRWKVNFDNASRASKGLIAAASFKGWQRLPSGWHWGWRFYTACRAWPECCLCAATGRWKCPGAPSPGC